MTDIETALRAVPPVLVCQQFHVHASDDCYAIDYPALAAVVQGMVEEKEGQRQAWEDTAAQAYRNTDYYRSLVREIGMMIGSAPYIADDGTVNDDVLCAKVPELIPPTLAEQAWEIAQLTAILTDVTADANLMEEEIERLRETFQSIAEYWNGHENCGAMHDACQEITKRARAALRATPEVGPADLS